MIQAYSIEGTSIKIPSSFRIERYNISKASRLSSGKMTMDFVAKKRKFHFTYDAITNEDLQTILDLIDTEEMFFDLTYIENNVEVTVTVYVGAIPQDLHKTGSKWVWKGISFNLIEQ